MPVFPVAFEDLPYPDGDVDRMNDSVLSGEQVIAKLSAGIDSARRKVGLDDSTDQTSHDYKLSNITGTDKAASLTEVEDLIAAIPGGGGGAALVGGNVLMNGDFAIWQRYNAGSSLYADATYCGDRWKMMTQSNPGDAYNSAGAGDGATHKTGVTLSQTHATPQRIGLCQVIESKDCYHLRGKEVTFQVRINPSTTAPIRMAILEFTGTEDVVPADIVNDWTSGTYSAGNFFNGVNPSVIDTFTPIVGWQTLSITGMLNNNWQNLVVMIWTEGTVSSSYYSFITGLQLTVGDSPRAWNPLPHAVELAKCQRFFEAWGGNHIYEVLGNGQANSSSNAPCMVHHARKRIIPTFSWSALSDWALTASNFSNQAATSLSFTYQGFSRALVSVGVASGMAQGDACFLLANATIAARMYADAEM